VNEGRIVDASLRPLIAVFEQLYGQNLAMKRILMGIAAFDWEKKLLEALSDIEMEGKVRKKFANLYESLENDAAFHQAVQEFLNVKRSLTDLDRESEP
jgi:hypothetical protein